VLNSKTTRAHWRTTVIIGCLMAAALLGGTRAHAQSASGVDIKAAFIFNFAKFVEWPADQLPAGHPLLIGVLGNDTIADALYEIAKGKLIQGRPVYIKRLTVKDDIAKVHVLFIDRGANNRLPDLIEQLGMGTANVLTVSDADRFCASGGIIQFRHLDDRVQFDVHLQHAETAGLIINSKLLALAKTVHPAKPR